MEFNALIAAGGLANRLGALPRSKEIFPIVGQFTNDRIKVVCENLIEYYKVAGINNIHFIIRKGKWDIPQLLGDGSSIGVNISYKIMDVPFGTPFTLDQAYPFIKDKNIFGLSNTALKVSILDQIGFDRDLVAVDWYLYTKLLLKNGWLIFQIRKGN